MIRALVFDFDGLILDTESSLINAYADVYAAHGVSFDQTEFLRSVGHADYTFDPWHAFEKRADRAALEVERRQRNRERDLQLVVMPGIVALFDEARKRSWPLALASNSPRAHCERHLQHQGLLDRFAFLACREAVASPKPEPDLYRLAVNHLGVRPHEAVAFEDSHTGTLAAKRAGLHVVAVPNGSTAYHDFTHADWILNSMLECRVAALLEKFGGAQNEKPL